MACLVLPCKITDEIGKNELFLPKVMTCKQTCAAFKVLCGVSEDSHCHRTSTNLHDVEEEPDWTVQNPTNRRRYQFLHAPLLRAARHESKSYGLYAGHTAKQGQHYTPPYLECLKECMICFCNLHERALVHENRILSEGAPHSGSY